MGRDALARRIDIGSAEKGRSFYKVIIDWPDKSAQNGRHPKEERAELD